MCYREENNLNSEKMVDLSCLILHLFVNVCFSDDLSKLQYTLWCIKESMRLYPPVYEVYRELTDDVKVGEYTIPKGSTTEMPSQSCVQFYKFPVEISWVIISIIGVHYNPEIWENPEVIY